MQQDEVAKLIGKEVFITRSAAIMNDAARPFVVKKCILIKQCKGGKLYIEHAGQFLAISMKYVYRYEAKEKTMSLELKGYCLAGNEELTVTKPITNIDFPDEVQKFIVDYVQTEKELRILNSTGQIAMHIKDQTLLYPLPAGGSVRNKWSPGEKKFVTIDIDHSINTSPPGFDPEKLKNIPFGGTYPIEID